MGFSLKKKKKWAVGSGVASVPLELGRKCQADLKQKANNRAILCSVFVCVCECTSTGVQLRVSVCISCAPKCLSVCLEGERLGRGCPRLLFYHI